MKLAAAFDLNTLRKVLGSEVSAVFLMRMNQSFPPLGVALAGLAKVNRLLAIQGIHLRLQSV